MVRVVADAETAAKLAELSEAAEVYDAAGQFLGRFEPQRPPVEIVPAGDPLYSTAVPPITDEELDRIEQEPGGRTLAEIWQRLRQK
jgi:hypothetical protein